MSKKSNETALAVKRAAGLAARRLEALENDALRVREEGEASALQFVASAEGVHALIRAGNLTIQIENGAFAVDIAGNNSADKE